MKLTGYRIKSTDIDAVMKVLGVAKKNVASAQNEEYHRLLSDEIEFVVDSIATGTIPRPSLPVIDFARARLADRIRLSECKRLRSEYSFATQVIPIPYDGYTYLLFDADNMALVEAFAATDGIEDFSVELDDEGNAVNPAQNGRVAIWNEVRSRSDSGSSSLVGCLTSKLGEVNLSLLHFASPAERATDRARHSLMNRYLAIYSCGQEIHPYELMRFMDMALMRTYSDEAKDELHDLQMSLLRILPEITEELITK